MQRSGSNLLHASTAYPGHSPHFQIHSRHLSLSLSFSRTRSHTFLSFSPFLSFSHKRTKTPSSTHSLVSTMLRYRHTHSHEAYTHTHSHEAHTHILMQHTNTLSLALTRKQNFRTVPKEGRWYVSFREWRRGSS